MGKVNYISLEEALEIHKSTIENSGGGRFIIQVDDFNGEVGDTYTYSLWQRFDQ